MLGEEVSQLKSTIELLNVEREGILHDRDEYLKSKAKIELSVKDIEENDSQREASLVLIDLINIRKNFGNLFKKQKIQLEKKNLV